MVTDKNLRANFWRRASATERAAWITAAGGIIAALVALAGGSSSGDSKPSPTATVTVTESHQGGSAGGGAPRPAATPTPSPSPAPTHTVTYKIGGTAERADLTYSTPSGQEQRDASVPWRRSFKDVREDTFDFFSIAAQNQGRGTITCEIYVDGVKVKAAESIGEFKTATCRYGF